MRVWLKSRSQKERDITKVRYNKVIIGKTERLLKEEKGQIKVFVPKKRREEGEAEDKEDKRRPRISSSGMPQE